MSTIIIGAGIGGLATATYLTRSGEPVGAGRALTWQAPAEAGRYRIAFQVVQDLGDRRVGLLAQRVVDIEVVASWHERLSSHELDELAPVGSLEATSRGRRGPHPGMASGANIAITRSGRTISCALIASSASRIRRAPSSPPRSAPQR
jgi:glycine/D-amino acid oxidase-like deaminating enzyme